MTSSTQEPQTCWFFIIPGIGQHITVPASNPLLSPLAHPLRRESVQTAGTQLKSGHWWFLYQTVLTAKSTKKVSRILAVSSEERIHREGQDKAKWLCEFLQQVWLRQCVCVALLIWCEQTPIHTR